MYNPGVHDMSGQILAQGIDRGIAALGEGIRRAQEERRRKEEEKRAKEAVQAAGSALFGEGFDLKDAPRDSWGQIIQLAQAKREEPLRQLQMTAAQLANENSALNQALLRLQQQRAESDLAFSAQAQPIQLDALRLGNEQSREQAEQLRRNRAAVGVALNPQADTAEAIGRGATFESLPTPGTADPQSALRRAALTGADVQTLNALAETVRRSQPPRGMEVTQIGGATAVLTPAGNLQFVPQPRATPQPRGLAVEISQLRAAQQEALARGDTELADVFGKAMQAKAQGRGDDMAAMGAAIAAGMAGRAPGAGEQPKAAPAAAPKQEPKAHTPPPAQKGARVRQNGVVYEFDGAQWKPL